MAYALFDGHSLKSITLRDPAAWQQIFGVGVDGPTASVLTLYREVPWLYRAVTLRAGAVASLPYTFTVGEDELGPEQVIGTLRLPLDINLPALLQQFETWLALFGQAYASKEINSLRRATTLSPILPTTIEPVFGADGLAGFKRQVNGRDEAKAVEELFYVWYPAAGEEQGPGDAPARIAGGAAAALLNKEKTARAFFKRGGIKPTLISIPERTGDFDRDRLQNWLDRTIDGLSNVFKAKLWRGDLKATEIGPDPEKMALRELTDICREDIGAAMGVPPSMLAANAANFACLPGDQRVFTPYGSIPIADLNEGDSIWQYDMKTGIVQNTVAAIVNQGSAPVYEIRTPHRALRASENHLFLTIAVEPGTGNGLGNTRRQSWQYTWKRADEIEPGDILVSVEETPDLGVTEYDGLQITDELMEVCGLYLGDGDITQGRTVRFAIPESEAQDIYAEKCERVFSRAYTGYGELKAKRNHHIFIIHSAEAVRLLHRLGFTGNALTKRVPAWVFTLSKSLRLAFLRGYLDSDGTVNKNRGAICYAAANEALINDIRTLCLSCGIPVSNLGHHYSADGNYGPVSLHRFTCGYSKYNRLIGANNPEKQARLQVDTESPYDGRFVPGKTFRITSLTLPQGMGVERVSEVEFVGEEDVYDLSTSGTHTFIAEGLVVHNTSQQDVRTFHDWTVIPEAMLICNALNEQVFAPYGLSLCPRPDLMEMYQDDKSAEADKLIALFEAGGLTINELRGMLDLGELTGQQMTDNLALLRLLFAAKNPAQAAAQLPAEAPVVIDSTATVSAKATSLEDDLGKWQQKALRRWNEGKPEKALDFVSEAIPGTLAAAIRGGLEAAQSEADVKAAFIWGAYP